MQVDCSLPYVVYNVHRKNGELGFAKNVYIRYLS